LTTPGTRDSAFSTLATHDAQVMPSMRKSTVSAGTA